DLFSLEPSISGVGLSGESDYRSSAAICSAALLLALRWQLGACASLAVSTGGQALFLDWIQMAWQNHQPYGCARRAHILLLFSGTHFFKCGDQAVRAPAVFYRSLPSRPGTGDAGKFGRHDVGLFVLAVPRNPHSLLCPAVCLCCRRIRYSSAVRLSCHRESYCTLGHWSGRDRGGFCFSLQKSLAAAETHRGSHGILPRERTKCAKRPAKGNLPPISLFVQPAGDGGADAPALCAGPDRSIAPANSARALAAQSQASRLPAGISLPR